MTDPTAASPAAVDRLLSKLRADPAAEAADRILRERGERTLARQVEISEVPAPPFGERARGRRFAELMESVGLADVRRDDVGNVLGWLGPADTPPGRPFVVSAHLDTVFPEGTDVRVTRQGTLLRGPGISDDARGLAAVLALGEALAESGYTPGRPLLFVGTVGEEGVGDLRGVKRLFSEGGAGRGATGFISLDGAGLDRIVTKGLGSTRFRVRARGRGGHSWVDFGTPNPIHALAPVADGIANIPLPGPESSSVTIARWGGGTSINAIPRSAWLEIDTRSEDSATLARIERELRSVVAGAAEDEPDLAFDVETIGLRPCGATDTRDPLVQAARAATRAVGGEPELVTSSTDANIPMSEGIPAITMGCGGEAGRAHTPDEWYRDRGGTEGLLRALYTVLLATTGPG